MLFNPIRTLVKGAAVLVLGAAASGCYVETRPVAVETDSAVVADGYEPMYYDGYVVYYDDGGRPFYYVNGAVVWVPYESPYYAHYVNHWHLYGPQYRVWYGHYGYRYRGYRPYGHYYGPHRGYYRGGYHRR